jgi:hypothetical protein
MSEERFADNDSSYFAVDEEKIKLCHFLFEMKWVQSENMKLKVHTYPEVMIKK